MILFLSALSFAVVYGAAENRLFREQGEWAIMNHFKQYHVFLGYLTVLVAALGCEGSLLKFVFLLLWAPFALDVAWWLIRLCDFIRDYEKAKAFYNEPNPWHLQTDWDNAPIPLVKLGPLRVENFKPPLVLGVYWWWVVFAVLLVAVGLLYGLLPF